MGAPLTKSKATRSSGNGGVAENVSAYNDGDHLTLDFTLVGDQRDQSFRVAIHPDDFLQVAHQMQRADKKAFLAAFAKAILGQDYR
ncbi:hypothetical protein [Agrobacterium pusense]|uniref:hypothetical protein n=1 Tax=Agrobacterium pusense TaxID=648995 RepID=UPI0022B8A996|nr:hypothetical protein [Agrobacterium pusense]MCZ7929521.1 hypothetical protein [Agrobacterium pusense]